MRSIATIILRLLAYLLFIQLFKLSYGRGAAHGEINYTFHLAVLVALLTGLIIVVTLAILLGKRAGRRWAADVAIVGEERTAAQSRLECELLACAGVLTALPSAYASGAIYGSGFVTPFVHAVISYLAFFVISLIAYSRSIQKTRRSLSEPR